MLAALKSYVSDIVNGFASLLRGMRVTGYYFTHPREVITQQYPENRDKLKMFERFRGEVVLIHDENNQHRCTGCSACEIACPNGSIEIIADRVEINGKKKKVIDKFVYHLQMCTMCNLCILACPTDAIKMGQNFEHAVYNRAELTKILNRDGSRIVDELL